MRKLIQKPYKLLEWAVIVGSPLLPLFFTLPYRINLFLAWEGAYRMSLGQIPYQDFGTPVGYVFWVLPALFFKLFGPYVITLLKTQVFINIVSNILFARIMFKFGLFTKARILALTVFILSYTLFNFWPWYNHLVFVIEMGAIYTAILYVLGERKSIFNPLLGATLVILAFLTKQDTGGLSFVLLFCIYGYAAFIEKKWQPIALYLLGLVIAILIFIIPFTFYDFNYWFNMGQAPHFSRLTVADLLDEFLGASKWLKFYAIIVVGLLIYQAKNFNEFINSPNKVLPFLIVLFILAQAAVIQITSYTPLDGNIYFHSFFIVILLVSFQEKLSLSKKHFSFWILLLLVGFWWSNVYWVRFARGKVLSHLKSNQQEQVISKNTYLVDSTASAENKMSRGAWSAPQNIETFQGVKIPQETIEGIHKLSALSEFNNADVKVLNMSELTPLTYELDLTYEEGEQIPLWYHKGVAFFDREVEKYCDKIDQGYYDIILFQDIPDVNNFYPYEVKECIGSNYQLEFKFLAPRIPEISYIYVYRLKKDTFEI